MPKERMGQIQDVIIVDEDNNNIGSKETPMNVGIADISSDVVVPVSQLDLYTTFHDILKELKKMNLQLAIMTDNLITNQDVEV
jgi:hypothetical protein